MCRHEASIDHNEPPSEDFPWHLGVYDAHCHPTDTMASITSLASMRAAALTIMATRSEDQDLVVQVTDSNGIQGSDLSQARGQSERRLIPSFGWHPWFSHQLYDDSVANPTYNPGSFMQDNEEATEAAKKAHYQAVLSGSLDRNVSFFNSLPMPVPISSFIAATRARLLKFPNALVGEVGLDKAFRLPQEWDSLNIAVRDEGLTPGGREGRLLSPHRVRMQHQQDVLKAQLRLAGETGRAVSVHGVQAHGVLFDTVSECWKGHEIHVMSRREMKMVAPGAEESDTEESGTDRKKEENSLGSPSNPPARGSTTWNKPYPPRICLHSYSGSADLLTQWMHPSVPARVFVSFSSAVNLSTESVRAKIDEVIRKVPDERILIESDLHTAGDAMDAALQDMYTKVCMTKGWKLKDGIERIRANFQTFIFG